MLSNSRQTALNKSRDRLARSLERFERLAVDAVEAIDVLKSERVDLERRVHELEKRLLDEQSNGKHNEVLYASLQEDLKSQETELRQLILRREEQEVIVREQLQTIERLENELAQQARTLAEREAQDTRAVSEVQDMQQHVIELEERLLKTARERDELREQLYAKEREESQWAVKLTTDEQHKVQSELDRLLGRIAEMERHITNGQKEIA